MAATATQDEDIIIFNDEAEETLEIVNDAKKSLKGDDLLIKTEEPELIINETEELISFGAEDISVENAISDVAEIEIESPGVEEQLLNLESLTSEDNPTEEVVELVETENKIDIDLESLTSKADEVTSDTITPQDFKESLIEAQDGLEIEAQKDGASFEDMGIDLAKLGDSEGANLDNINLDEINLDESLVPETDNALLLGVDLTEETPLNLDENISSLEDLTAGFADTAVDEGTHNGILEAAILKLISRKIAIDEDIAKRDEKKSEKKDNIAELKKQIKALEKDVSEIDSEISELNTEKKTINKTEEGIEKMKIAA